MKPIQATTKAGVSAARRVSSAGELKTRKEALERGERTPSRVFRIEKQTDGTFSRVAVDPESQRRKAAKAWEAKSEVAKHPAHDSGVQCIVTGLSSGIRNPSEQFFEGICPLDEHGTQMGRRGKL